MEQVQKRWRFGKNRKGFTLTEMLVAIGIIAVLTAIVIPSIISMRKTLEFKRLNNYAEEIYMAVQSNLVDQRVSGSLTTLETLSTNAVPLVNNAQFPEADLSSEYYYATEADTQLYELLLPAGSIDETLRQGNNILIEYNPVTGNVYSVFYSESGTTLSYDKISRDETERREMKLGYYSGSGLSSSNASLALSKPAIELLDGEEAIVQVTVPIPSEYLSSPTTYATKVEINLVVTGEQTNGSYDVDLGDYTVTSGNTLTYQYIIDSLADKQSFASLAENNKNSNEDVFITTIGDTTNFYIQPGENVTITATIKYSIEGNEPDTITLGGVNPMFSSLQKLESAAGDTSDRVYDLYISNGRELQNLNAISPDIAKQIKNIYISNDIYWNETVDYYTAKYATGSNSEYTNDTKECPARGLPYFVPISNESLFTIASFSTATLPALSDTSDATDRSADVYGGQNCIYYLNIDADKTDIGRAAYYAGSTEYEKDRFTGLFSYVDTTISGLYIVNSTIKGISSFGSGQSAVGSLVGACGHGTFLYDCGAYIDTTDKYYSAAAASEYGVTGCGAVGGLVGYAKSHSTTEGTLSNDSSKLAFSKCFAAVPVTGKMRGYISVTTPNSSQNSGGGGQYGGGQQTTTTITYYSFGYTNGVGGLVGVSNLTNFYDCYASGNVTATGVYTSGESVIAYYMGVGGFVGTSHGTKYANCFATGNVSTDNTSGAGGFVGIVNYDEAFNYTKTVSGQTTTTRIWQSTTFTSCYCVGLIKSDSTSYGKFSGTFSIKGLYKDTNGKDEIPKPNQYNIGTGWDKKSVYATNCYDLNASDTYVYKDCYYLNLYGTDQGDDCATVVQYGDLTDLITYQAQLAASANTQTVKNKYLSGFTAEVWESATAENTHSYTTASAVYPFSKLLDMDYYGDWQGYTPSAGLAYFEKYTDSTSSNSTSGYAFYLDSDDQTTDPDSKQTYTITSVSTGSVYGDGYALLVNSQQMGSSFDINNLTISVNETTLNKDEKNSYFEYTYTYKSYGQTKTDVYTTTVNNVKYYVLFLKPALINKLVEASGNEFYSKIELSYTYTTGTGSNKKNYSVSYVAYFNPSFALTQVNYALQDGSVKNSATKPTSLPSSIKIRTARQLYALSQSSQYWGDGYNYFQELNIDYNTYLWSKFTSEKNAPTLTPIGTADAPFNGTYNGGQGYVASAQLTNVLNNLTSTDEKLFGLFGVIGKNGEVQKLTIADDTFIIPRTATTAGVVAGQNNGTIIKVTLTNIDSVKITDSTSGTADSALETFGLLAGENSGTIENCTVNSGNINLDVTKAAGGVVGVNSGSLTDNTFNLGTLKFAVSEYAGGVIGQMTGGTVSSNTITGSVNVTGGKTVGGFVGCLGGNDAAVSISDVALTVNNVESTGGVAAGFAGEVNGTSDHSISITGVALDVKGDITSDKSVAAGFASEITNATVDNVTVNLASGVKISGTSASGVFGEYSNLNAGLTSPINSNIQGYIVATSGDAAGILLSPASSSASSEESDSSTQENRSDIENCFVYLSGTISAESGDAAGLAVKLSMGNAIGYCHVYLNNAQINGNTASGFCTEYSDATTLSISSCDVSGAGYITGTTAAAGFAKTMSGYVESCAVSAVSLNTTDLKTAYINNSNEKLTIESTEGDAAGFAVEIIKESPVHNSYVTGTVKGVTSTSGFVTTNNGGIYGSMANVDVSGSKRSGFVGTNAKDGLISECYNWYTFNGYPSNAYAFVSQNVGTIKSCYAASLDTNSSLTFGSGSGTFTSCYSVANADDDSQVDGVQVVSYESMAKISLDGSYFGTKDSNSKYPYSSDLSNTVYPYPMLSEVAQYGNWKTASEYAYGVAYYEIYEGGIIGFDTQYLSGDTSVSLPGLQSDKTVKEYGYVLIGRSQYDFIGIKIGGAEVTTASLNALYTLKIDDYKEIDSTAYSAQTFWIISNSKSSESATITTASGATFSSLYGPLNGNNIQAIRTPQQFQNIQSNPGGSYTVTRMLDMTDFDYTTISSFSGTLTFEVGAGLTNLYTTLFGTIENGTVSGLTLDGVKVTSNEECVGILANTLKDATVKNVTLENCHLTLSKNTSSDQTAGLLAGSSDNSTIKDVEIVNSSLVYENDPSQNTIVTLGGLVGTVSDGSITNCTLGECKSVDVTENTYTETPVTISWQRANDADKRTEDDTYFFQVGGLVGQEVVDNDTENATYEKNTVTVELSGFDSSKDTLGLFIAIAQDGEFKDCTVWSSSDIPFLATVVSNEEAAGTADEPTWTDVFVSLSEDGTDLKSASSVTETTYKATFENCVRKYLVKETDNQDGEPLTYKLDKTLTIAIQKVYVYQAENVEDEDVVMKRVGYTEVITGLKVDESGDILSRWRTSDGGEPADDPSETSLDLDEAADANTDGSGEVSAETDDQVSGSTEEMETTETVNENTEETTDAESVVETTPEPTETPVQETPAQSESNTASPQEEAVPTVTAETVEVESEETVTE